MALVLLNPGLRPLGLFDGADGDTPLGGEWGQLGTNTATSTEGYAADVGSAFGSGITQNSAQVDVTIATRAAGSLGGLVDEGRDNYGTLFGTAITMYGTGLGSLSSRGVVTLGPKTSLASGKVTLWAQPGLYGVTTDALSGTNAPDADTEINDALHAEGASTVGRLTTDTDGSQVGINVGMQRDRSLVSTTATAAGETAQNDHLVLWLLGNSQA
tara:strand:- start:792 stop:1433 length:642 start_codon:yes stop_codon:yes gene_type:complete